MMIIEAIISNYYPSFILLKISSAIIIPHFHVSHLKNFNERIHHPNNLVSVFLYIESE